MSIITREYREWLESHPYKPHSVAAPLPEGYTIPLTRSFRDEWSNKLESLWLSIRLAVK